MTEKQTSPIATNKNYLSSLSKGQGNLFNEQFHLYVAYKRYMKTKIIQTFDWLFNSDLRGKYKSMSDMVIRKYNKVRLVANKLKR